MTHQSIYINHQGELLLIDAPDKSQYIIDDDGIERYEAALASAIKLGIKFKDQQEVLSLLYHAGQFDKFTREELKGKIFPLPTGYKVSFEYERQAILTNDGWKPITKQEYESSLYDKNFESFYRKLAILSKLEEEKPCSCTKFCLALIRGSNKGCKKLAAAVIERTENVAPSEEVKQGFTDKQRIDWLEKMMTPDDRFCEIYFAGLRDFKTGRASSFQIESNPDIIKYQQAPTLREVIDLAIKSEKVLE